MLGRALEQMWLPPLSNLGNRLETFRQRFVEYRVRRLRKSFQLIGSLRTERGEMLNKTKSL
jgi:hypothetical protein